MWHHLRRHHQPEEPGLRRRGFGFPPMFGPFSPHPGHGPHRGRGGRGGRRANLRPALLALLLERPMHGYEMIQELESRTGGIWRPSPGSVYPTLQLLEDSALIVAEQVDGRRRFTLTESGRAEATEAAENPPWADFADDTVSQAKDFHAAVSGIMGALRQVGMAGTANQRTQALSVLTDTRRRLYAILAEDEEE